MDANNSGSSYRLVASSTITHPDGSQERGINVADVQGNTVFVGDAALPRLIALLTLHLSGQSVALADQEGLITAAEKLAEAIEDVEQDSARREVSAQVFDGEAEGLTTEKISLVDLIYRGGQ